MTYLRGIVLLEPWLMFIKITSQPLDLGKFYGLQRMILY